VVPEVYIGCHLKKGGEASKNGHAEAICSYATTYLCKKVFPALMIIKTKARNCFDPGNDMHIALSKIEPCIDNVMRKKL